MKLNTLATIKRTTGPPKEITSANDTRGTDARGELHIQARGFVVASLLVEVATDHHTHSFPHLLDSFFTRKGFNIIDKPMKDSITHAYIARVFGKSDCLLAKLIYDLGNGCLFSREYRLRSWLVVPDDLEVGWIDRCGTKTSVDVGKGFL